MFKGAEELRKRLKEAGDRELFELSELLEMQQTLDENIYREKGIEEYPLDEICIALITELGELMNEFPTKFKYWKDTAIDNREKGLEEYVDCLHFALSITNYIASIETGLNLQDLTCISMFKYSENIECKTFDYEISYILEKIINEEEVVPNIFELGNILGFKWKEIYKVYKDKNKVNYERLQNGY